MSIGAQGIEVRGRIAARVRQCSGRLREVAIGAAVLFAKFVDHLGVAGNLLPHGNHARTHANGKDIERIAP
jgi:hypothetical protein